MPKTALLPVVLTPEEKLNLLDDLSVKLTALEALEAEKKALPERIKTLLGAIHVLNHAKASGFVEREVEIREEPNAFAAKVKIYRVDTGEFVRERDMDPEEAQMQLGNSSVPGPTPDNVRSLAEHREKTEEQLAAGTPEEAEALREARLADEREARINEQIAALTIETIDRGDGTFVARVTAGEVPGVTVGLAGPVRGIESEARKDLVNEIRRHIIAAGAAAEVAQLASEQQADDASTGGKPKNLLKAPKGAKGKKLKIQDEAGAPLPPAEPPADPNGVDTTPPDGPDGEPLSF